jgi:hypothetical protein
MDYTKIENIASNLIDDINNVHPEYLRGVCELIADLCPQGKEGHSMNAIEFARKNGATQQTIDRMYYQFD